MLTIDAKKRHHYDMPYMPGERLVFPNSGFQTRIELLGDITKLVPKWNGFPAKGDSASNIPLGTQFRQIRIKDGQEVAANYIHTMGADGWLTYRAG